MSSWSLPSTPPNTVQVPAPCASMPESAAAQVLSDGRLGAEREKARLEALRLLEIMDTPPEVEMDDLVQLAATICGTPIGLLSFIDERRMWLKAAVGLEACEIPRELSFCHHTIQDTDLLMIENTAQDDRFCNNPFVDGEHGLRFYAGIPLETEDRQNVGTLCVLDYVPRSLSAQQQAALRTLASQIQVRLALRMQHRALQQALQEARTARAQAEALEHRFQIFMDSGPFLAYMKDEDGRLLYYNEPLAKLFQVSRTAFLHKTDEELWPEALAKTYRETDRQVFRSGTLQVCHEETCNPDGARSIWRSYKFPYTGPDGRALMGGVSIEVTKDLEHQIELQRSQAELEIANRHLSRLASLDALTGLANRRTFDDHLRSLFREARRTDEPLSVLMLDVDRFKQHNDRFGHAHGDSVLRELANCLTASLRVKDLLARFGGEEFAILLPNTTGKKAHALAERLLELVRARSWPLCPVTVSIGVSTLNPATRDTQHLLGRADEALYAAKSEGRDRVVSYADALPSLAAVACSS